MGGTSKGRVKEEDPSDNRPPPNGEPRVELVNSIAAKYIGTCAALESEEFEDLSIEELQLLDEQAVQCVGCSWWFNPTEEGSDESGEYKCEQCEDEEG